MTKFPVTQEYIDSMLEKRNDPEYNAMMRISDISKLHRDLVRKNSDDDGLPCSYRLLLYYLSQLDPGVTQLTLVKAAHLKPPTVSVTLQKMEASSSASRMSTTSARRSSTSLTRDARSTRKSTLRGSTETQ